MTPVEIISAAADLLEKPGAWTQGAGARDEVGLPVDARSKAARCWCVIGAMARVLPRRGQKFGAACEVLERHLGVNHIAQYQDAPGRTQAEVVAAMRGAIQ